MLQQSSVQFFDRSPRTVEIVLPVGIAALDPAFVFPLGSQQCVRDYLALVWLGHA